MPVAVLDIGTNTVLLLIAEFDPREHPRTLIDEARVIRVGEGIHHTKRISAAAVVRLNDAIRDLSGIARDRFGVSHIHAFGTSVFRRAQNCDDVVADVATHTGVVIEILSGDDEARWTFVGGVDRPSADASSCVIDIGGGSTEVVIGKGETLTYAHSAELGVVVLQEEFFHSFPPDRSARESAKAAVVRALQASADAVRSLHPAELVAVAGTPTTLAALELGLRVYDPLRVHGMILTIARIAHHADHLLTCSLEELRALPCVDLRRADVLPAGALLLRTFMEMAGFDSVRISDRGVRYGIALREWRAGIR